MTAMKFCVVVECLVILTFNEENLLRLHQVKETVSNEIVSIQRETVLIQSERWIPVAIYITDKQANCRIKISLRANLCISSFVLVSIMGDWKSNLHLCVPKHVKYGSAVSDQLPFQICHKCKIFIREHFHIYHETLWL